VRLASLFAPADVAATDWQSPFGTPLPLVLESDGRVIRRLQLAAIWRVIPATNSCREPLFAA